MQRPLSHEETLTHKFVRRTIGGKPCWAKFEPLLCTWEQKGLNITKNSGERVKRTEEFGVKNTKERVKPLTEMVKMSGILGLGKVRRSGVKNC